MKIAIIGGTGLDDPDILKGRKEVVQSTIFGMPSDQLITGTIGGIECVLLARHGRKHTIMPSHINFRANIWALKEVGCTHVIATTACGSLKEEIRPGDLVFIDQFIDRTWGREVTFYDGKPISPPGVCHIPMAEPFCQPLREILANTAEELVYRHHKKGTVVSIQGPRYSSKAESFIFRSWGGDLINMTTVPEVVLANEAGLCYAAVALATDYDCWRTSDESVSVLKVAQAQKENSHRALELIRRAIPKIAKKDWSEEEKKIKEMVSTAVMLPPQDS